jgi:predicted amino acid dehydrogenase
MYSIAFHNEAFDKDVEVSVPMFPVTLKNGHTVSISKEQVEEYEAKTGNKFEEVASGIYGAKVTKKEGK